MLVPPYTLCHLQSGDIALMRELNALFGTVFGDRETYSTLPPDDAYLKNLLERDHVMVLVAMIEHQVVGGLVAYELEKYEQARREIYLYDLAVDADPGDHPAIALYEKLGTREDVLHFDIKP